MSLPPNTPLQKRPGTDIWQDALTDNEIERLRVQDHLMTTAMDGVLSEQTEPEHFKRILDIGSGTGNWLLEVAQTYPTIPELIGIDANPQMIASAQALIEAQHVSERVRFRTMDALTTLDLPRASFDLVNLRFASSFVRTWEWPHLLTALTRITRTGGVIRLTESTQIESNSPIVREREQLFLQARQRSGHIFDVPDGRITDKFITLLHRQGLQDIRTHAYTLDYHDGSLGRQLLSRYLDHSFRALQPFLRKWVRVPENQEELSRQLQREMQAADFTARVHIETIWGYIPQQNLQWPN